MDAFLGSNLHDDDEEVTPFRPDPSSFQTLMQAMNFKNEFAFSTPSSNNAQFSQRPYLNQSIKRPKKDTFSLVEDEESQDGTYQCQELIVKKEDVPLDATLCKSVLLQNYLESYGNCVFFIAPVWLQALDSNHTRELFALEECHSDSDNALLLNFYIALALGAKQCGDANTAQEYFHKARGQASCLFDCSSYEVATGLTALAITSFGEGDWIRGGYYLVLASSICKNIGANNSHVYLRGMWWKALLPDSTPESRLDMIGEYQNTLTLPQFPHHNGETALAGPVPISTLDRMNSLSRVFFSCYTILGLSKLECPEEQMQSNLRLLHVLQSLEDEVEDAFRASIITFTIYLTYIQSIYGLRASIYWSLGARLLSLQWAHKFLEKTQCTEWRFNMTFAMLPFVKMVAEIFIETGEFETVEKLLAEMRYLCMTDKACKVMLDEIRNAMQQKMEENSNPCTLQEKSNNPTNRDSNLQGVEPCKPAAEAVPAPQLPRNKKRKQNEQEKKQQNQQQQPQNIQTKTKIISKEKHSKEQEHTKNEETGPSSSTAGGSKPKQIQWYQWENSKLGIGGFNRESSVVKGERVFRVGKLKPAAAKDT